MIKTSILFNDRKEVAIQMSNFNFAWSAENKTGFSLNNISMTVNKGSIFCFNLF